MRVLMRIKSAVWGAVFGALAITIVGFSWMGWTLGHTTMRLVAEARESAAVDALTPFCVSSYLKQPDASKQLALLREDTSEYTQRDLVEKAGFATMPGKTEPSPGLASACVKALRTASPAGPGQPVSPVAAVRATIQ